MYELDLPSLRLFISPYSGGCWPIESAGGRIFYNLQEEKQFASLSLKNMFDYLEAGGLGLVSLA